MGIFNLDGRTALVTGGGRGIGRAMAVGLAEAGADIVLLVRDLSQTETKEQIEKLGRRCSTYACDLELKDSVSRVIREVLSNHEIHILLNAAGIQRRVSAEDYDQETYEEVMQVNLGATFTLCRETGKYWIKNGIKGSLINTASLASFQGGVRMSGYAVSKGGIAMLTKALSNEWATHGIRVNAIAPGYIATDMNVDTRTNPDQTYYKSITDRIPMGRWGEPEEFKGPVVFLASKASSLMVVG
ncbi:2-deoxy-D-gluconate 3-dehydrogenase [Talaromyces islandicus]|uniref:2-deoxy-D-gluconate 3-dehydrogenase n=1 Tax=Talaromyces islandicus TaxID=28573 RepID=A0A0U1LK62_TALIS|nr:2-deoxy-D-gluconate 3-dehydrogenase [Talaromyces islandicus]